MSPTNYIWAWWLPVEERVAAGRALGFEPASVLQWSLSHGSPILSSMKSFRLDRLIAGVELSGSGEWIVLQETPDGVTILEAWRFPVDCAAEDCPGRLSAVLRRAGGEPWVTNANQAPERREILRLS